jgi:hypothetical protein
MGIRILKDEKQGYSCLYCSTTMWAFGGIFYDEENPEDFLQWLVIDPRSLSDSDLETKISDWREHLELSKELLKADSIRNEEKEKLQTAWKKIQAEEGTENGK